MHTGRFGFRLALTSAALAVMVLAGRPAEARQAATLSDRAEDALDQRWATWTIAPLDPSVTACAADAAAVLAFDVDGDQGIDRVAIVSTPDGARLVALLSRPWGADLHDIDAFGEGAAAGYIAVTPPGTAFRSPRTGLDHYLSNPTITVRHCGSAEVDFYEWLGFRFERITIPGG